WAPASTSKRRNSAATCWSHLAVRCLRSPSSVDAPILRASEHTSKPYASDAHASKRAATAQRYGVTRGLLAPVADEAQGLLPIRRYSTAPHPVSAFVEASAGQPSLGSFVVVLTNWQLRPSAPSRRSCPGQGARGNGYEDGRLITVQHGACDALRVMAPVI